MGTTLMSRHLSYAAATEASPWWCNLNIPSQGMLYIYHRDCGSFLVIRIKREN